MAHQFIHTIRNARGLAKHEAARVTHVSSNKVQRITHVHAHFLQGFIGDTDTAIAVPGAG